jgi:hypothetical protein
MPMPQKTIAETMASDRSAAFTGFISFVAFERSGTGRVTDRLRAVMQAAARRFRANMENSCIDDVSPPAAERFRLDSAARRAAAHVDRARRPGPDARSEKIALLRECNARRRGPSRA